MMLNVKYIKSNNKNLNKDIKISHWMSNTLFKHWNNSLKCQSNIETSNIEFKHQNNLPNLSRTIKMSKN